jgi:hypothetical protein
MIERTPVGRSSISKLQEDAINILHDEVIGTKRDVSEHTWNSRHEVVLKEWAEQAVCYQKMHEQSHRKFARQNIQLTLPVIVMSTITGTANFSLASFDDEWRTNLPILIGSINILAGMITTIAQYLRVSEKSEGHRVAALAYGKLARNVGSELNLPRNERTTGGLPLVRACRNEMDRLEEQSPDIGSDIVAKFELSHGDVKMSRPSIVNIHPVTIYNDEYEKQMKDLEKDENEKQMRDLEKDENEKQMRDLEKDENEQIPVPPPSTPSKQDSTTMSVLMPSPTLLSFPRELSLSQDLSFTQDIP